MPNDTQRLARIETDVKEIKVALLGNPAGAVGLVERVDALEHRDGKTRDRRHDVRAGRVNVLLASFLSFVGASAVALLLH